MNSIHAVLGLCHQAGLRQSMDVLEAVYNGASTTRKVSDVTGKIQSNSFHHMEKLCEIGLVKQIKGERNRTSNTYETTALGASVFKNAATTAFVHAALQMKSAYYKSLVCVHMGITNAVDMAHKGVVSHSSACRSLRVLKTLGMVHKEMKGNRPTYTLTSKGERFMNPNLEE